MCIRDSRSGKHVVTANKALIAMRGNEIFAAAQQQGVMVAFEAAVAGGIPVIKAVREGLAANRIEWLAGIINGTSNFILTEMRDKGRSFGDVLAEAQALGYAEADPTFDLSLIHIFQIGGSHGCDMLRFPCGNQLIRGNDKTAGQFTLINAD